ncbi:type II toxin-antitoxin system RelE/ParE family toxin [Marinivivus vitaminiproducens]|uniref:type II toxin-antitoxin system RelE/ParE family toxin n=1 Tax=Marinivivus vitaminiproducens TaxID=3035935 RepID=UPI00279D2A18|nr:type II toxin-antitoxin system RelE/ParE family toxin [Geminicoccaceae bacterium SCSIO 64248]
MTLRYTSRALREIERIQDFIAESNPWAAFSVANRLRDRIHGLASHPRKGRRGRVAGTRELVIDGTPYIVVYRIDPDGIAVLAVIHAARRWPDRL